MFMYLRMFITYYDVRCTCRMHIRRGFDPFPLSQSGCLVFVNLSSASISVPMKSDGPIQRCIGMSSFLGIPASNGAFISI